MLCFRGIIAFNLKLFTPFSCVNLSICKYLQSLTFKVVYKCSYFLIYYYICHL
nr:MAG TPA: hypothetical protein [Caudoviricetes sp.]